MSRIRLRKTLDLSPPPDPPLVKQSTSTTPGPKMIFLPGLYHGLLTHDPSSETSPMKPTVAVGSRGGTLLNTPLLLVTCPPPFEDALYQMSFLLTEILIAPSTPISQNPPSTLLGLLLNSPAVNTGRPGRTLCLIPMQSVRSTRIVRTTTPPLFDPHYCPSFPS